MSTGSKERKERRNGETMMTVESTQFQLRNFCDDPADSFDNQAKHCSEARYKELALQLRFDEALDVTKHLSARKLRGREGVKLHLAALDDEQTWGG